jgi:AraC-like DNA-binding protein
MEGSGTSTFTDPDDYEACIGGASVNLVLTGRGDFEARLTWLNLRQLHVLRCCENLSRIAYVALAPARVFVSFPTSTAPPPIWDGVELRFGDIVFHSRGERTHQRTTGATQWGIVSLPPEQLAVFGKALTGLEIPSPPLGRVLRPSPIAAAHLLYLHSKACRLAETKPDMIAHREVARALEQELLHAIVNCLTADDAQDHPTARRRHSEIMARFEHVLAAHRDRQLPMPELCAAVGVPERTLRLCCAEFLGMSPGSYVRLRRLNLVRAALRRADPAASIAEIARRYGFSEPGRFAVAYRTTFGETPSATLRAVRSSLRDPAAAEFA